MKNEQLSTDEYDALELVRRGVKREAPGACVGRNLKRLSGIKMMETTRDGRLQLTEKGQQVLFLRRCVQALTALENDPAAGIDGDVARFLSAKSHIVPVEDVEGVSYALTERGRESLADIAQQQQQRR